jgi:hypothetical protein
MGGAETVQNGKRSTPCHTTATRARRLLAPATALLALLLTSFPPPSLGADAPTVDIPDRSLLAAINAAIGVEEDVTRAPAQDVTTADVAGMTTLPAQFTAGLAIGDLTGLQAFTNLTSIQLVGPGNTFTDLTPLSGLAKLTDLSLDHGVLTGADLAPLAGMTGLRSLQANDDRIADVSSLSGLAGLTSLTLSDDQI